MDQKRAKELEVILDDQMLALKPTLKEELLSFDSKIKNIYNSHYLTITDCLFVVKIYFEGFEAINQGTIECNLPEVYNWIKKVERKRSGRIIGNLIATQIVSTVEFAIQQYVAFGLENNEDFKNRFNILKEKFNDIELRLKPSGKPKYLWPEYLLKLFDINPNLSIIEVLKDLIRERNEASHTDINVQKNISGENIKNWIVSANLLLHHIAVSLNKELK